MPDCGSQCWLCDYPVHFDTYTGCTHDCRYCFARKHGQGIEKIGFKESAQSLYNFIKGERNRTTRWCDWDIPIHIGGLSDPFQPCEKKYGRMKECLEVLAETQYPFIISTKGKLCVEPEYLELLKKCNVCFQVSAVCSSYDKLEKGAPTFEERLEIIKILSENLKRVNVRVQPYMHEVKTEVAENIPRFAEAGVYGIVFEGMKFQKKKAGLVRVGGDMVYPLSVLKADFGLMKQLCHDNGLRFWSGENRLRTMGDSLSCCGTDGLDGFIPNKYNLNHLLNGDKQEPTPRMCEAGTGVCFKSTDQSAGNSEKFKNISFRDGMLDLYAKSKDNIEEVFAVNGKNK